YFFFYLIFSFFLPLSSSPPFLISFFSSSSLLLPFFPSSSSLLPLNFIPLIIPYILIILITLLLYFVLFLSFYSISSIYTFILRLISSSYFFFFNIYPVILFDPIRNRILITTYYRSPYL